MPAKRGFCWCLGGRAPPEISHIGLDNGGMTPMPIEVEEPMPTDQEELNSRFTELVDELGLDKAHREAMFNLPPEKKWQIYCSKKKEYSDASSTTSGPEFYIDKVSKMTTLQSVFRGSTTDEEIDSRTRILESLRAGLRTQTMSYVIRFIELDGLTCLVNFLRSMDWIVTQSSAHSSAIGCLKALMNSTEGRSHVLAHPIAVNVIAESLRCEKVRTKVSVLEILGALCLVPGGHRKVLQAMVHFQTYAAERTRFQTLISDFGRKSGDYHDDLSLHTAIMSFINAALKYGAGQTQIEFRLHLRYEFLMLGIQPIIDSLRNYGNTTLDRHLDFFEMVRNEDERLLAKRFESTHVDTRSASVMFELLRKKLAHSTAYQNLLSILLHLLQLPIGKKSTLVRWQLIDKVIQQVALHTSEGEDPDQAPMEIDMKKISKQLASDTATREANQKLREVQKLSDDLQSKLSKKEHECDVKAEEKEELMQTLNKIKSKLDKEVQTHYETRVQLSQLMTTISELEQLLELERLEREKLELAVKTGSLPDDTKMGLSALPSSLLKASQSLLSDNSIAIPPPPPPSFGLFRLPCAPPAAPCPPSCIPPPPPPGLGPPGLRNGDESLTARRKDVPQSSQPLKCFNWVKLPDNKVKGSIWSDVDDIKMYKKLDLGDFESKFSAYQRHEDGEPVNGKGPASGGGASRTRELSIVDGRRAQNCTILLSKLKMTNQELKRAIMTVDGQEEIPKDMCEQLLKFVPTPEEVQMLSEHEQNTDQMARADRFLFEMSRIDHYEQRLKALYYKKKFNERLADLKPKVQAVLSASKEVCSSAQLKQLLEVVLALGNYMNRGQRGNAVGFKISSLNKIIDTKSSVNRRMTLLHYIASIAQAKFPCMLKLESELKSIRDAAKVNLVELEADTNILRNGLQELVKEVEYHKTKSRAEPGDKFVNVMSDFVSVAAYNFTEFEELFLDMKSQYERAANRYCEDPAKVHPEEFFGVFDQFLVAFLEAQLDNERFKKLEEEEARRQQMEGQMRAEREARERERVKQSNGSTGQQNGKGEFDDLISALRTGEVFGEDMAKLKRPRGRRLSTQTSQTESAASAAARASSRERILAQ